MDSNRSSVTLVSDGPIDPQKDPADPNTSLLHPLFSSEDGDTTLGPRCGSVFFRVHSYTLKTTSGWFRTMFSLPQRSPPTANDIIYLDEEAATLEALLRMVCGQPVLRLESIDAVENILCAAEKYDMPGPMSISPLMMSFPLSEHPLRLYAIACKFGWVEEAKLASTETLKLSIHAPEYRTSLSRLNTESLLDLIELHRSRREELRARLDHPPFVVGGTTMCAPCGWRLDYHTWRELKYKIIMEMDARPLGDTILDPGLPDWFEAQACWIAKCPNADCHRLLYDKASTISAIKAAIDNLTNSV